MVRENGVCPHAPNEMEVMLSSFPFVPFLSVPSSISASGISISVNNCGLFSSRIIFTSPLVLEETPGTELAGTPLMAPFSETGREIHGRTMFHWSGLLRISKRRTALFSLSAGTGRACLNSMSNWWLKA